MNISKYFSKFEKLVTSKFNKLSLIIVSLCLLFSFSFAIFVVNTDNYKAAEMYIGNLIYTLNMRVIENGNAVNGNVVTIPDEYTYTVMVDIGSLNPVRTKYKLQYDTDCTECQIFISDVTGWNPSGSINASGTEIDSKTVKVIIINTSGSSADVEFRVTGGYNYHGVEGVALAEGFSNDFKYNYVDSNSNRTITELVKADTECTPTEDMPCYYGGEEQRNYITNNEKIYRILGVYLINGVEYVKIIQEDNESTSSYSGLNEALLNYNNSLPNNKLEYLTGEVQIISANDYVQIGAYDSYLNDGEEILTNTTSESNVFYVTTSGELKLKAQTEVSNIRPVLVLKSDARIRNTGDGSSNNPYIIQDSTSDIIVTELKVDGAHVQDTPKSGLYSFKPNCTNGTATWSDKQYLLEFSITNSPMSCVIEFESRDFKLNTKVNGVSAPIPTTGNYSMDYDCSMGNITLVWDNTNHEISISNIESPVLCEVEFTSI